MSLTRKILQGSASNVARVVLSMAVALALPPLLVDRLSPAEYGAWILILQCSGYMGLLDFGLQTAVSKFVAEFDAREDRVSSGEILSSSFLILCFSALAGALVILVIAWQVPRLFHQMPVFLVGDFRIGILAVGLSTLIALPFGAFLGVFTGLQRYGFPTVLAITSKVLSSATLAILLLMHGRLLQLVWILALFNVATAIGQFAGWRKYARERAEFAWRLVNRAASARLVRYGGVLTVWSIAGLLISGLDIVIVGHYDFKNTGYYGLAASATNFLLMIIAAVFGPLVPAMSSLQARAEHEQIGTLTIKSTRYSALLLALLGLPLAFAGYWLLRMWVGPAYAVRSVSFLEVLILGNAIRQLGFPYSLAVIATGKQHLATISGVAEALVNIGVSVFLVRKIGAIGVAIGTVVGAFVSVGVHLAVSMKYTRSAIAMSRRAFVAQGWMRPMVCIVPSLLLMPAWNRFAILPWSLPVLAVWIIATPALAWQIGLTSSDRSHFKQGLARFMRRPMPELRQD
jgi:O-antigen/teichoic acid export membrane protein